MKNIQSQKITLFASAKSVNKYSQISIENYFRGIIDGQWQDEVLKYRAGKLEKANIHAVTASGIFSGRKDSDLIEHSGLLVIDIDAKDNEGRDISQLREQFKEIPEVFAIHTSVGGHGLAVYFRINRNKHPESFEAITRMLANDYEIICDMHNSNVGRLRFVSYDPDCYLNFGAGSWSQFPPKKSKSEPSESQYSYHIFSENDVEYIMSQVEQLSLNIAPDYYTWLRIGFGLAAKFGEAGRKYFKTISSFYYDKQRIEPDKQYDRCLKSEAVKSGKTSIKSFFYYAKLAGCNLTSERTSKIKTVAKIRRKQESQGNGAMISGKSDARQYLDEYEGITGKDVDEILDQVWQMPVSQIDENDGLLHDIEVFLKSNYKLRLNEITNIIEVDGDPIDDYIFNSMYLQTCRIVSEKISKEKVKDLIHSNFTPKYNPLHEWFEKNKHVKSTGHIKELAGCIDSDLKLKDVDFVEYYLTKWLLSIVGSAYGTHSILCLVLTGQVHGIGKTLFFRGLLPESLRWLYAENKLDVKESDIAPVMSSKLIIMDDEFGGKSKQDEKKFKELISKDVFTVRMPYKEYYKDMKRLAVLCGTSNEEQILNDLTGNRRIIPIQVNYIDEKKYAAIDKDALFIELYWLYKSNPTGWFLNKEDIERLNEVCSDSRQVAPEVELPLKYFQKSTVNDPRSRFVSASEIRSICEQRSGIRMSQQKLSVALKNIGYVQDRKLIDGQYLRGFWVIDNTYVSPAVEQIKEEKNNDVVNKLPF